MVLLQSSRRFLQLASIKHCKALIAGVCGLILLRLTDIEKSSLAVEDINNISEYTE